MAAPIINSKKLIVNDEKDFKKFDKLEKGLEKFVIMTEKFQGKMYPFKPDYYKKESFSYEDIEISESFKIKIFFIIDGFPKVWINGKNMYVSSINKGLVLKKLDKKTAEWKEKKCNVTTARRLLKEVRNFLENTMPIRNEWKEQKEIEKAYKIAAKKYRKAELEERKREKEEAKRQRELQKIVKDALKQSAVTIPFSFF